jgi:hypothetical protein
MQVTELSRQRDNLNGQNESLRSELAEAKREVALVRQSVIEEKQSLEQRLDEERRAKERVRHQLDTRMEQLAKQKSPSWCAYSVTVALLSVLSFVVLFHFRI